MTNWIPLPSRKRPQDPQELVEEAVIADKQVTVQEYSEFIDSQNFMDDRWWQDMPPMVIQERATLKERIQQQRRHPNWPVVQVGVGEAIGYCRWRTASRTDKRFLRLPTVSELKQLLSINRQKYCWGNQELGKGEESQVNWAGSQIASPCPVGAFPPHRTGLYDVIGNVWEWCINTITPRGPKARRSFTVFGCSFYYDPQHYDGGTETPFVDPPPEFEYQGEGSIGFRCTLSNFPLSISSVNFSRDTQRRLIRHSQR